MKIAMMGIRGIPANYGGFETLAEELCQRLAEKGIDITVYGRSNIIDRKLNNTLYKNVRLLILPTISHKYLDTVFHTFLSVIHGTFIKRYDIIFICNAANSIFSLIPRLVGTKVVVNVDGIERKRKKWNFFGKLWYNAGEIFSCLFPNVIVSDAEVIKDYYLKRYGKKSVMIPYGVRIPEINSDEILKKFSLKSKNYILYVSRLEPENNADLVIRAFRNVNTSMNLVIVGDVPYNEKYKQYLKKLAGDDSRIIFTGYVFGTSYWEMQRNACLYVQATEVGGTHPALIEAMGSGNCILALDTPENREVLKECGLHFSKTADSLQKQMQYLLDNTKEVEKYRGLALERAYRDYSWETVSNKYRELFYSLVKK